MQKLIDQSLSRAKQLILSYGRGEAEKILEECDKLPEEKQSEYLYGVLSSLIEASKKYENYRRMPVKPREFFTSPDYMDKANDIWPIILDELEEINSGKYEELVATGSIGSAKTSIALYSTSYQLYTLSCLKEPHREFGLDPSTEIVIIFQSVSSSLARSVDYMRFKTMIEQAPYFQREFRFDKDFESELRFPNRIIVKPISGKETGALGQNVIGGIIDELNFMAMVENSKKMHDKSVYDQATENYNAIARRRKNRFGKHGKTPGLLCLVSSKRYPGQFTDQKEEEAKTDPTIYVYDKRHWEVQPDKYSGEKFPLFIGDESRNPRILDSEDDVSESDQHLVQLIPIENKKEFERDIYASIRDIAGISTLSTQPFFSNVEAVAKAFGKSPSIFSRDDCDFVDTKVKALLGSIRNQDKYRWLHIDLALTGDSAGLALSYVDKFVKIERGEGVVEYMPDIVCDGILEVRPPRNGEIEFGRIRQAIYNLVKVGIPIRWISFDGFQSVDMMQILRQKGFIIGYRSMDKNTLAYDILKSAIADGRFHSPDHIKCRREMLALEKDVKKNKIDHPPSGSKDCSDALAGSVAGLTLCREIWAMHRITHAIPGSLVNQIKNQH